MINESYSRIEEYNGGSYTLQYIHGTFGTGNQEFNRPHGLAYDDTTKYLYVLDTGNNRVSVYNVSGGAGAWVFVTTWGSAGSAAGYFNNPKSIDVAGGYVYIADTGNNRIQRCLTDGTSCQTWGSLGFADGKFSSPEGVAIVATESGGLTDAVFVADTGNNRIQRISSSSGTFQAKYGSYGSGTGSFINPIRVANDTLGNIYVLDSTARLQKFSTYFAPSLLWTLPTYATGVYVGPASTLFISELNSVFEVYNGSTGAFTIAATNEVGHPTDISIDTSNNFYITNNFTGASAGDPVVQKFDSNFIQLNEWGGTPTFAYTSGGPLGIGTNTGNDVYVADTDGGTGGIVQKFTSAGDFVVAITPPTTPGPFLNPKDVATEATGKFYVADTGNRRIIKFDSNGAFVWSLLLPTVAAGTPTPPLNATPAPYGITIGSDNKIYVADAGYHRILRYHANDDGLNPEASWGEFGSDDSSVIPQLDKPQGMAIDTSGNIYVADTGNNRIQRFNQNGELASRVVWGTYGAQDGKFDGPRNVVVDSQSKVYVSETGNRRIQAFGDATGSAALVITNSDGVTIAEGTSPTDPHYLIDSYTVRLNTQPSTTVNVNISVSNSSQASVSSNSLVFTPYNWYIPQVVTVYPTHDNVANGTHNVILTHTVSTVDLSYRSLANTLVTVTINDSIDTPGITFSTNTVPWATEGAQLSNAYSIVLNTQPTGNVTVSLAPDSSLLVSPTSVTFTPTAGSWNTPQFVHLFPVHDFVAQGTHSGLINHTASSTDPLYTSPTVAFSDGSGNVSVNIQDIDTAGVTVSKSSVSVSEGGTTESYTINLTSKPVSDVNIFIQDASPSAMVTMQPSTVLFTPATWSVSTPQTVVVSAIHDFIKNPINPRSTIIDQVASSGDPNYNGIAVASVSASVTDVDTGGLLVSRPGGGTVTVSEAGATDNYEIQLSSIPTDNVTVTITSTDGQATTSAYFYTFTPGNWNTPQTVTARAVNDALEEGTHTGVLLHTLASNDSNFDGKTASLSVSIQDDDASGITIRLPNGVVNLAEGGPTDSIFVRLNSQPTAQVILNFTSENQATGTPALLTFTPANWMDEQEVVLYAIQDYIIEGPHTANIVYTSSSADAKYVGKTASFVANISDDDSVYPGINIVESNGSTEVVQGSGTDSYDLTLTSKPTANVKIKIVTDNPIATTSAGVFWFTPANWNVAQTVTVLGKSSPSLDADLTAHFTHLLTSADAHYNNIGVPTVTVIVRVNRGSGGSSASTARPPTCGQTPPYDAPNLFQITTNQTQATLYFTPILNNITYFFIAYGYTPGDIRFGASYEYGPYPGVVDYTVNMLAPGTTYYFQVRAGNGCATGPWSSSVKAITVGPESSALTTRNYYASAAPSSGGTSGGSTGGSTGSSSPTGGIWLTRDLYPGSQGADVRSLQEYLNAKGFVLANSGPGSPGNETTYYGNLTASAVRRFQEAHFQEILSPLGYFSGTGICGPATRAYINSHPQ